MPAWGLDVGSSAIKLIALGGKPNKAKLGQFGLAVNPVGNIDTENESERVKIAQAIKKLVGDVQLKTKQVVVALPESKVFTRLVEMPALSDAELASAINWEAEQYIPIPMSEVQLDYKVVGKPAVVTGMAKMQVFLVATPTALVQKYVELLEMAGLETVALETELLAITRTLTRGTVAVPGSAVMIAHFGANTTDFCVVEGERLVFTRSLPTGGTALSRAMAKELGLEVNQAEQYKRTYGLDPRQLQSKVRNTLLPVFASLVNELRKGMQFYAGEQGKKIVRIILSGGGAYLPEMVRELAAGLGVEVLVGNPWAGIEMDATQQKRVGGIGAVFSVAMGLALRGIE